MSLVSDMLSKVKLTPPTRETPPGLRADINQAKRKKIDKKYKIALALSIVIAFMIIVAAFLVRIYVIKAGDVPENLHKLKSKHTSAKKEQGKSETLNEKIEEALKAAPKKVKTTVATSDKKTDEALKAAPKKVETTVAASDDTVIVPATTPPDLLSAALNESDKEKTVAQESMDKTEVPAVIEEIEPEIGAKKTYHFLYKASRSEKAKDYLGAISIYNKILVTEPTNYIVMNKIASLLMKMNMWKEAMDQLRESYTLNKDYIPTLINIGIVYASTENYLTAEKYFQKALAINPIDQDAIFSMALMYEKQNMNDKAAELYSRLRKLGDERGNAGLERVLSFQKKI